VDLDEILYGGDDTEDDLDSILLNPVVSDIPLYKLSPMLERGKGNHLKTANQGSFIR
jgi:hypothetical protein